MKKVARLRVQEDFVPPCGKISIDTVSVRTTGRIKKPKAVYDPSDNYVPRAQRLTQVGVQPQNVTSPKSSLVAASPTTTVAKIGRERSLSAGSNTSNTSSSQDYDICAVCEKREPRRGGNYRNKLFRCVDCNKKVHRMCATIDFYEAAPVRQSYKCENCRTCEVCSEHNSKANGDIVVCAKCCKSYHPTCHMPKVTKIQQTQRNWKCFKCAPNTSNAIINNSSSNGKEESMPVTVIRQIIGDDVNLQPLQKAQPLSQSHVPLQHKIEQSSKNSPTQQQPKSQERGNVMEVAAESAILAKAAGIPHLSDNKRKSDSENLSSTASSMDESDDDDDYNYVEKKKRKILHKDQESNNNNNKNGFDHIEMKANDSDSNSEKKTVSVVANHVTDDTPDIPKREIIRTWSVERLTSYFEQYFPNEAYVFKDQEIDGNALLLLTRSDVVQKLPLKLGPSLRLFNFILKIQTQKTNDPTLGWDCSVDTSLPSTE